MGRRGRARCGRAAHDVDAPGPTSAEPRIDRIIRVTDSAVTGEDGKRLVTITGYEVMPECGILRPIMVRRSDTRRDVSAGIAALYVERQYHG